MINKDKLNVILSEYKKALNDKWWENEQFKWQAVKCFQENWDIEAEDFTSMYIESFSKTESLLTSYNCFPYGTLKDMSENEPEKVREMFQVLYDEDKDLDYRFKTFKESADSLAIYTKKGHHYQDENALTTYLWLKYPDKYWIYKFGVVGAVSERLEAGYSFVKGHYKENIDNFFALYNELNGAIIKDKELLEIIDENVVEIGCEDPNYRTMTTDLGFFISKKISDDMFETIVNCGGIQPIKLIEPLNKYTKEDFLSEVYMDSSKYDKLVSVLRRKKNIVLQGAPGVGKTYCAKRLAYSMMGEKDENRIEFVQFHQNYCYEDFIMGYKPSGDGFELKHGIFYNFCKKAAGDSDNEYFFIIDEINRGNMSKIFGELLMLIEADYRGDSLKLAYEDIPFTVPKNLYIIGMMNTADRSLAMIDYALRRRFSFFDMEPGFETEGFKAYKAKVREAIGSDLFDTLIYKVIDLNKEIEDDKSLGKGFCIGHSYFCNKYTKKCTTKWMQEIVEFDILPMLREYWFDDESKYKIWTDRLNSIFN